MCRNLLVVWPTMAVSFVLGVGLPAQAAALCAAGNPNTTTLIESTPTSAFTINGNGTVVHAKTGLMWKQCAEGWSGADCGTGSATGKNWSSALTAAVTANASAFGGYTDWRLPNVKELESIVERCGYAPTINKTVFPATSFASHYWTSSHLLAFPPNAWAVDFNGGFYTTTAKSTTLSVRLVRGGVSSDSFDLLGPTVRVAYHGNGNTGGTTPADPNAYAIGATANVLGNPGNLVKAGATFAGWGAVTSGAMVYTDSAAFPIVGDAVMFAQWNNKICTLDIDGNSSTDALTDGLLVIRAMFGLTGNAVTTGAIGGGVPSRTTWAQIQQYLNGNCGMAFAP